MNFDLMRLIAALLVVVSHTFPLAGQPPFTIRGVEKVAPRLPPSIGQHTDEVLREIGYDEPAIARLRAEGTVA